MTTKNPFIDHDLEESWRLVKKHYPIDAARFTASSDAEWVEATLEIADAAPAQRALLANALNDAERIELTKTTEGYVLRMTNERPTTARATEKDAPDETWRDFLMHQHALAAARALGAATKHLEHAQGLNRKLLGDVYDARLKSLIAAKQAVASASGLVAHTVGVTSSDGEFVDIHEEAS